jgi:hypothetical protein
MTTLKEIFHTGTVNFVSIHISVDPDKVLKSSKDLGIKKVQSLIKIKMDEIERLPGWRLLPPTISNAIRHAVIRIAFGAYKIGLLIG